MKFCRGVIDRPPAPAAPGAPAKGAAPAPAARFVDQTGHVELRLRNNRLTVVRRLRTYNRKDGFLPRCRRYHGGQEHDGEQQSPADILLARDQRPCSWYLPTSFSVPSCLSFS